MLQIVFVVFLERAMRLLSEMKAQIQGLRLLGSSLHGLAWFGQFQVLVTRMVNEIPAIFKNLNVGS